MSRSLLDSPMGVVSAGASLFGETLAGQGVPVEQVDWRPPADGSPELASQLGRLWDTEIDAANQVALRRLLDARQVLVDVRPAGEVVPGMERDMVLHAGPPIDWVHMSAPIRAAAVGAMLHEGLASDPDAAEQTAARGDVRVDPSHHHH